MYIYFRTSLQCSGGYRIGLSRLHVGLFSKSIEGGCIVHFNIFSILYRQIIFGGSLLITSLQLHIMCSPLRGEPTEGIDGNYHRN